jgi:23S rRNA (adenine-N6)-dimethyltransferase
MLVLDLGAGTGALTSCLVGAGARVVAVDIVLQRAVVRRYEAGTFRGARRWEVRPGMLLPRRAFVPPPQVDSAVLVVRRR